MNETVTTERARELLGSDYVKHIPDIRDLIAEALAAREFDGQCEADLATVESSAVDGAMRYFRVALENVKLRQRIAELTASLAAAQAELAAIKGNVQYGLELLEDGIGSKGDIFACQSEDSARREIARYPTAYAIVQRYKAGPWTAADPRAGEVTKEQK